MIRLLFVLFVTLGGFAAAALWNFRNEGGSEKPVAPAALVAIAAEADRLGLAELLEQLPAPKSAITAAPADSQPKLQSAAAKLPSRPAPAAVASDSAKASPSKQAGDPRDSDRAEMRGAGGSAAPDDPGPELVAEVEVIVPRAEFARDIGLAPDSGVETASDALPVDELPTTALRAWDEESPQHDADRSARLIRRMIAVYRSSGSGR